MRNPSGEQDLSREGLGFFLAMVRSGDEKAVEVVTEEFDRLHRVIEELEKGTP